MSLDAILARLAAAETASGRAPGSVTLIAVSKLQPSAQVEDVLERGHRIFGENYVQEAAAKWPGWTARFAGCALHMIGPLQTNKVRLACEIFAAIQSVDRPGLADRLARIAQDRGRSPDLFVQVNTGAEPQKAGVLPGDADAFVARMRALDLPVTGLMCIPPEGQDSTPHFRALAAMARRNGVAGLSMGMSGDFEAATMLGATAVRVGSSLFE